MPYTTVDGLRIAYIDEGVGQTVLLLHGWGAPAETYRLMIDHLSGYCRVVAPDLPGFGGSDEPTNPWTPARFAAFVNAFAATLSLQDVVLIGHSNGGRIALHLLSGAASFTVKKAILMDAAGIKPRRGLSYYYKVYTYKAMRHLLGLPGLRHLFPNAVENARKKRGSADYRNASPIMRQSMVAAVNEDSRDRLPRIAVPTLLIWGERDTATPLRDGQLMEKHIPDAGLVVLPNAGHFAFAERWDMCRRVLDSFLQ